jgi:hypothetical protein
MGEVYRPLDTRLDRVVAIKTDWLRAAGVRAAIIPLAVRPRQRLLRTSPRWRGFLASVRRADHW